MTKLYDLSFKELARVNGNYEGTNKAWQDKLDRKQYNTMLNNGVMKKRSAKAIARMCKIAQANPLAVILGIDLARQWDVKLVEEDKNDA